MKLSLIIGLCICFFSCTSKQVEERTVQSFGETGKLTPEICHLPSPIYIPRYMGVTGDYLYVYKERENKKFVVFKLPEMKYLGEMGSIGQGPNDFNLLDTRSFKNTADGFQVVEVGVNLLKKVCLCDSTLYVKSRHSIFNGKVACNGFYDLGNNKYLTFGGAEDKNEFSLYDLNENSLKPIGRYPQWADLKSGMYPFVIYMKTCAPHPEGGKIAVFYSRFKRMRIYDGTMQQIQDVKLETIPFDTDFEKKVDDYPVYYIGQPYATERFIYALCSLSQTTKHGESELHIWNWDGEPVACYDLGRKISLMAVSEKHEKIYALNNEMENEIYIYDLPIMKTK